MQFLVGCFECVCVCVCVVVVSIGGFAAFKVILTPLEYVPNIPPLSSYVINI